jgi:hypothetical protein
MDLYLGLRAQGIWVELMRILWDHTWSPVLPSGQLRGGAAAAARGVLEEHGVLVPR